MPALQLTQPSGLPPASCSLHTKLVALCAAYRSLQPAPCVTLPARYLLTLITDVLCAVALSSVLQAVRKAGGGWTFHGIHRACNTVPSYAAAV
jgi:hypothetical protein